MKKETETSARTSLSRTPWRVSSSSTCSRSNCIKDLYTFEHIVNIVYFNFQLRILNLFFHQWLWFKFRVYPQVHKTNTIKRKKASGFERAGGCNPMGIGLVLLHLPDDIFCFTFLPPQNHLRLCQWPPQLLNIPSANIFKYFQNNNVCKMRWQELASDGESGRPSRSCNLFKSGIFPTESAPFLSKLCPGATPPWGSSFSRVTPLAAPRPNMMSSSLFFFLLLSSVVPSANFLLFCKPSLSKADSNLDGGLLEEVLVCPAAFRFCKSAINELVSEASPLTGVISILLSTMVWLRIAWWAISAMKDDP